MKVRKFLKILSAIAIVTSITVGLTACGGEGKVNDTTGSSFKEQMIVAQGADAKSLDPHATNDQPSSRVTKQIYDRLVEQDENMKLIPGIAKEWKQVDDLTWEFTLNTGIKFHNGDTLKASDVAFSLNRMKGEKSVSHIIESIDTVTAKDDNTVVIKTSAPFAPLLTHLAHPASSILSEKVVKEKGADYGQNPIGTGPYKFSKWEVGSKIHLEKNKDYFGEKGKTEKIIFTNIKEGTNRTIGLETGEIDLAYDIDPTDTGRVKDHADLKLTEEEDLSYAYIGMNNKKEPFNNVKVRQAINYAVNKESIIKAALYGTGTMAKSPIGDKVFGHTDKATGYPYNLDKAKELMKESGHEKGFKTTIWTNDNSLRTQIAQIVQSNLKEIGIEVEIVSLEWGSYLERTAKGEHDMFILGWTTVTADADYGLYPLYHSKQHGSAGNRSFYTNPEVDKLLDKAKTSTNQDERKELYDKAVTLITGEAPEIMLYYKKQNVGMQKKVEGFKLSPAGHHSLKNVTISK
ncbi:glutathione ABC transporter substrate-binding protein [Clostridium hydrogeniformans]|uniref:glutathione ABC transporter substrate-binding protein n=1 Tax=Clostridium hydrogeniformans TaxID=349933 RepID=UPI00047F8F84|nr:glutathione ABC transporter substrate-binding protein [Clostridium hydrogeniformans]